MEDIVLFLSIFSSFLVNLTKKKKRWSIQLLRVGQIFLREMSSKKENPFN